MFPLDRAWQLPEAVTLACLLEASSPKAGNVHPQCSFRDMEFHHFSASAMAIQPSFIGAQQKSVGEILLDAVRRTQARVGCNTNLGTLMLFAPIAKAWTPDSDWPAALRQVLQELTPQDSQDTYHAIRLAQPGGLGTQAENDVRAAAPKDLLQAMRQVATFDAVARQYTNDFHDILNLLLPWLEEELTRSGSVDNAICRLQIRWLAQEPDGLITRKLGPEAAVEVQQRSRALWADIEDRQGEVYELAAYQRLHTFLCSDPERRGRNPRNPGTTADLIAATLLIRLLDPPAH
ncbi:MAG: triphosphoribosyl-dephospho-CoA synthase [bacterium]|nr:triphosphoribosyl-dephospho-CoA synthase [bacterium]